MNIFPNTLFVGKVCTYLNSVDSTQTYLKDMYANTAPTEGTVIMTYDQLSGYGQRESRWVGDKGKSVSLSTILYPVFLSPVQQFYLSMAVALAVRRSVAILSEQPTYIKWPNDIMIRGKKVSGILIETVLRMSKVKCAFIGIGINVKSRSFGDIDNKAISLEDVSHHTFDQDEVAKILMENIEQYYLKVKSGKYDTIFDEYNNHLYRRGEEIMLENSQGGDFAAKLIGVNKLGMIRLEVDQLTQEYVYGAVRIKY
ncbi:MAG TPA: biotin--[acetyl-CoA-carboxylase] ligase [Saprospiraceae bacterium]|nr:MAG: biotin-(acetyl-CoA carboxylase) ligase [Candidatus Parvibacillus calidus]MBX2935834.1 biotin--[acetyl-CoA-carboxylase] ligase [Saprospiraceae bacterium]MBX7178393.1 biotin--[acetyl-CoA-carboxylase] ligase [Saprospiraceae bacterium]MCB0591417.1 biotin--[acetyl-CoA-carboxylase] ligase [Saprospiraceae bacterium]MCC7148083.1 biotin--[acetyl-CoA-carboxylase] ligase [Saprospiraceae bacterium]